MTVNESGLSYLALPKNGRYYHAWKPEKYPFPCDLGSRLSDEILNGILYLSSYGTLTKTVQLNDVVLGPLVVNTGPLNRILDLGCGSRLWVSDTAKRNPDAVVCGVDLVDVVGSQQ